MAAVRFEFDWNPAKAKTNLRKHGVSFVEALTIFDDPLMLSQYDEHHSDSEDRWITMGMTRSSHLIVVCHTYTDLAADRISIRLISARRPTARERLQYRSIP
ncbi:BrnT family toxin [Rhizobiaceae bacterium CRRU44]|uniref:BrnT family toxin n=1 Tax=Ferranicluibacter rubi TaxID=2715133 RepID=A0AA43ZHT3_9HYPH|nr:BrnT family toxin [Ferranicluibacter rubi]NHT77909.1 BrnT family toxin [Ferranicluibacter rubi]TCP83536.1 hypothetical protein C8J31_109109 [Rhizobium sp. PP-CC-2G-626]